MAVKDSLIQWYRMNKRELPWRENSDAYSIWLSEIILQQTRVEQGKPYFEKFIRHYPEVCDLAHAKEDEVLKHWQGLGYYSRARNLHKAAKIICSAHQGIFPNSYTELLKLPGIGQYTAAAIASMAFNEKVAVVDGNVYRLLSRLFGISSPINTSKSHTEFKHVAEDLMDDADAGEFNQAMMEMGALQCVPTNPNCAICPVVQNCFAANSNSQSEFPVKLARTKVKELFFNFVDLRFNQNTYLEKREGEAIWKGLYQFPLIESASFINADELIYQLVKSGLIEKGDILEIHEKMTLTHLLSHRKIQTKFWQVLVKKVPHISKNNIFEIKLEELGNYPVPRLIEKYLERFNYVSK